MQSTNIAELDQCFNRKNRGQFIEKHLAIIASITSKWFRIWTWTVEGLHC